jgi:hypothetical protein
VSRFELPRDAGAPRWEEFRRLAALTALKRAPDGTFVDGHWWRGPLLHALVAHYRPRHVLEFGTGRGYGAACMAMAGVDGGFDCTVWTIDRLAPEAPQDWAYDAGPGPQVECVSLVEMWRRHLPTTITSRIRCLTGDSVHVMAAWRRRELPAVELCFIDGGHDYATARHDFVSALDIAAPGCTFVFDDYSARGDYGVRRLVDGDIRPRLPADAIETVDALVWDRPRGGQPVKHEMAVLRGEYVGAEAARRFYSPGAVAAFKAGFAVQRLGWRAVSAVRALARHRWHEVVGPSS